jgi:hypothetical protein
MANANKADQIESVARSVHRALGILHEHRKDVAGGGPQPRHDADGNDPAISDDGEKGHQTAPLEKGSLSDVYVSTGPDGLRWGSWGVAGPAA